jgi:hypothetical protein
MTLGVLGTSSRLAAIRKPRGGAVACLLAGFSDILFVVQRAGISSVCKFSPQVAALVLQSVEFLMLSLDAEARNVQCK